MSEFVAGAFVDVKPDAKGFRTDLKRQVDAQIKKPIPIPVELDPKRFKSTVANAARQTKAAVPVTISTTIADLRKQITDKINKASSGIKIKVPIQVEEAKGVKGATKAAAAAGGAGGGRKSSRSTSTADEDERALKVKRALKKADDELAIATRALNSVNDANITSTERATRTGEARASAGRAGKAVNDVLATSEAKLTSAEVTALKARSESATLIREATGFKKVAVQTNAKLAEIETKTADASAKAVAIRDRDIKSIKDLTTLKRLENELVSTDAKLKRQAEAADRAETATTKASTDAVKASVAARRAELAATQEQIVIQRAFLKGESSRQRQQKTAARGFLATGLSLLGIRGATLAASAAFLAGAVSAAAFAKAVSSFAGLQTELNVFQATTGATAEQMAQVAALAKQLGSDIRLPGVSATDAAQSMTELARAGLSVSDSMAAARGVLQLAAAAQVSFAEAAELTASALNAFGLEGEDALRVADLLANAANAAQGSISEMAAALAQASAIARQVGLTVGNTVAILTQFARNGLRGSDAGTSLRTALSRLIAPTRKASDLIDALNINLRDARGNIRPDVFVQFGEATKNLTPALRDMIAETIAGQDAIRAFSIGAREGARGLKLAQLQMAATGTAAQLAAARSKGLAGQFSALANNTQTLGTQLGGFAAGPVAATVKGLNNMFSILNKLATGDFGGIIDDKSLDQAEANLKQRGKALLQILNPLETKRPFGKLFGAAPAADKEQQRINNLIDALNRLQNLRVTTFQVGGNIGPITKEILGLRKQLRAAQVDAGLIIPVTKLEKQLFPLKQARKAASDLRKEILATGGSPSRVGFLDDLIRNFNVRIDLVRKNARDQARNLKNDAEKELSGVDLAKSFEANLAKIADNIDLATPEVLSSLDDLARKIKGTAPVTGAAGQEIGKRLIENITKAIDTAVEEDNPDLAASLKKLAGKIAALFGLGIGEAFKNIKIPLTDDQLEKALLPQRIASARAQAFGTVSDQISTKQKELDALKKQLGTVIKGSAQEEKILNDISSKQGEIDSLRQQQVSDAKERQKTADKKITDAISAREQSLLNKLTVAQADESVRNDIKARIALRNFYTQQIAIVKSTVKDAETRQDQIDALEQKRFEVEQDITRDRITRREQIRDKALQGLDDADERAQETETLADDLKVSKRRVRFWRRQVANLKALVRERKATGDELKAAREELDTAENEAASVTRQRREQKRETRRSILESNIEFASTTENKNAEIAARKRFIAFLEQQKKFVKGNILKLHELRNEIAAQNKAIKDLKGETEDSDKGTTVFEALKASADIFRQTGGNLITGNQPFAGPAGFTADMSQFLFRNFKKDSKTAADAVTSNLGGAIDKTAGKVRDLKSVTNDVSGLFSRDIFGSGNRTITARGKAPLPKSEQKPSIISDFGTETAGQITRLTGSIDRLAGVMERQPGVGKVKTPARATGIAPKPRTHFDDATAARRVVELRHNI